MKSVFRISLFFIVMSVPCLPLLRARQGNGPILYVGTANSLNGQGILCTTFDSQSGAIGSLKPTGGVTGAAAALLPHPNGKYLYATVPLVDAGGKSIGGVAAFTVDTATGALTEIDRRDSGGSARSFFPLTVLDECFLSPMQARRRWVAFRFDRMAGLVKPRPSSSTRERAEIRRNARSRIRSRLRRAIA